MTRFGDDGNCLQACLASILEIPLRTAPDPCHSGHPWIDALSVWLNRRAWGVVHFDSRDPRRRFCLEFDTAWSIAIGKTSRSKNLRHAVVYHNGGLVHDPLPKGNGLSKVEAFLILFPLNPAKHWRRRG